MAVKNKKSTRTSLNPSIIHFCSFKCKVGVIKKIQTCHKSVIQLQNILFYGSVCHLIVFCVCIIGMCIWYCSFENLYYLFINLIGSNSLIFLCEQIQFKILICFWTLIFYNFYSLYKKVIIIFEVFFNSISMPIWDLKNTKNFFF